MRIAAWSGPRNLSTALMYAFAQRGDCAVVDEPLYAAYLHRTGLVHPMRAEVLASQPTDPDAVLEALTRGPIPQEQPLWYQKHMAQHMVDGIDRGWIPTVTHLFLIRHPARVVASYAAKREQPRLEDLGFRQQAELHTLARSTQREVPVIDSFDLRRDPEGILRALCLSLGIAFTPAMLSWRPGGRPEDGAWAPHWYAAVHDSTGFAGPEGPLPGVRGNQAALVEAALPFYESLRAFALRPVPGASGKKT